MKAESTIHSASGYFTVMEGDKVILREGGTFRQVALFRRGDRLFAESKKGAFVKLSQGGATSVPSLRWDEIITDEKLIVDGFGVKVK